MSTRAIRGPLRFNTTSTVLTGNLTIVNESLVIVNKTSGAATTITLPASETGTGGRRVVKIVDGKGDSSVNRITIAPAGSDTINGLTAFLLDKDFGDVTMTDLGAGVWVVSGASIGNRSELVYRNVAASTAHTNSTTETLLSTSYSIPANTLKAGSVIKIKFQGIATATNSSDTLAVKLYIGGLLGTALLTGTATNVANSDIFAGEFTLVIRTAGASGTMVGFGWHTDVPAATGVATLVVEILASTAIDTTAAQVVGVGVDWSVADPGNSCRLDVLTVEVLN